MWRDCVDNGYRNAWQLGLLVALETEHFLFPQNSNNVSGDVLRNVSNHVNIVFIDFRDSDVTDLFLFKILPDIFFGLVLGFFAFFLLYLLFFITIICMCMQQLFIIFFMFSILMLFCFVLFCFSFPPF